MRVTSWVMIKVPPVILEASEGEAHQYAPCRTTCNVKESLQGLKVEGVDLAADA